MNKSNPVSFPLLFLWSCSRQESWTGAFQESWTAAFPFPTISHGCWSLGSSLILFTVHLAHNFRKGCLFAATQLTNMVKSWTFLAEHSESSQDYIQLCECRKQTSTDSNLGEKTLCLNGAHLRFSEMSADCYFPDYIQPQCINWQGKEDTYVIQNTFTETINAVALCLYVFSIFKQAGPCLLVVIFVPWLSSRHFVLR